MAGKDCSPGSGSGREEMENCVRESVGCFEKIFIVRTGMILW